MTDITTNNRESGKVYIVMSIVEEHQPWGPVEHVFLEKKNAILHVKKLMESLPLYNATECEIDELNIYYSANRHLSKYHYLPYIIATANLD